MGPYGDTSDNLTEVRRRIQMNRARAQLNGDIPEVSEVRRCIQMNRARLAHLVDGIPDNDVRSQLMDDRFDLASLLRVGDRLTMELHDDGTWSFELNNDYVPVVETGPQATLEDAARVLIRMLRGGK